MLPRNYKSPFASDWSGYKSFAMVAHSFAPRLGSGAESLASVPDIENSKFTRNAPSLAIYDFVREHLAPLPKDFKPSLDCWREKIPNIVNSQGPEKNIYAPVCQLLNAISTDIYQYYEDNGIKLPHEGPIVFLDHHASPPTHWRTGIKAKPDLIAVFASKNVLDSYKKDKKDVYSGVPSYHAVSTCECKPGLISGNHQAIRYTWQLLEARPDMPGVYGLCANTQEYTIIWSDPSGACFSTPVAWNNLSPLEAYIHSLYAPPEGHHLWDPTITSPTLQVPVDKNEPQKMSPHWTIEYGGKAYKDCNQIHIGDSWGRRTTVFMYDDNSGDFAVIKDAYRDDGRRFEEAALLDHIHSKGTVPGVVRVIASGGVDGHDGSPIDTARPAMGKKVTHRTKKRLVMGSRGSQLLAAKSVKDLLITIYDGTEVHRFLVNERDYLHRDISLYNFLMYPQHKQGTLSKNGLIENRPLFINDILGGSRAAEDNCAALFIDADNSALLKPADADTTIDDVHEELAFRTGTPRYIARAVSKGKPLDGTGCCRSFTVMPELTGKAKEVYINNYGQDTYAAYIDPDANIAHGSKLPEVKHKAQSFFHRPDHDVESIFWVLVFCVTMAKPLDVLDEPSALFTEAWEVLKDHTIKKLQTFDPRHFFLALTEESWVEMLHPRLSPIAPMMQRLAQQVHPEYGLLGPPPKSDHLHEAFRRIILEQILSMEEDPILLTPNVSRSPPDDSEHEDSTAEAEPSARPSKKRKAGDDGDSKRRSKAGRSSTRGAGSSILVKERYINN